MAWLGKRRRRRQAAQLWHRAILNKARDPELYQQGLVPDTLEGRFQMVTLATTLVLRRLREVDPDGRALADAVYRDVFSGFDHALREEGVGDSSIARKMRKRGEEFFGLARAVDTALASEDVAAKLAETIERNGISEPEHSRDMAEWVKTAADALELVSGEDMLSGNGVWSDAAVQS